MNVIFAGDLWQLPPVKGKAIFADPFHGGLTTEEQQIAKIFWKIENPIQHLFHLTKGHRTKDAWLEAVLDADRFGNESWEMYCFTHGLPTRNPGSWLPDLGPTCDNAACQTWAQRWQDEFNEGRNIPWEIRKSDECDKCKAARHRRNRVIEDNKVNTERYAQDPFTHAPFVHPLRAPSYHVQHLGSIHFARRHEQRLLWVVASGTRVGLDTHRGWP